MISIELQTDWDDTVQGIRMQATKRSKSSTATGAIRLAGLHWLLPAVLLLLLSGCAARTITLNASYPTPLVVPLPLTIGVYYPEELREFRYTEIDDNSGKDQYIINAGPSQVALFNTVLPVMFQKVVQLDSPTARDGVDAVFIPRVDEFQLGLPEKTRLSVYEVWMRYNMRLTRPNGDYIADWNMTAYGKSPSETFQSVDAGVQNAAEVAMRDLAATFSLSFSDFPDVKDWLQEQGRGQQAGVQ